MESLRRVYLDHSATTPVDRRVIEAMIPYLGEKFGNASSVHFYGQEARAAIEKARNQVATLVGSRPNEIVFLSGGTEANNLAIRGVLDSYSNYGRHVITSSIEHSSVRGLCNELEKRGVEVTRLPVSADGLVQVDELAKAIRPETVLVSIMTANNEIGTIQPIREIGRIIRERKKQGHKHLIFHTDAVQAVGRMPIEVESIGCDLLSMSAHKLYAPKGVGALFIRRGVRVAAQNVGGHQERERRAGTESVAHIVAFGEAAELAKTELEHRMAYMSKLRDKLERGIEERIEEIVINGSRSSRLPHLTNISFRYIEGEGLLINLDLQGIAISTGSACSSGSLEPSPVILALGRSDELARGSIRFSVGKDNTEEDIDYVLKVLPKAVETLRKLSPLYQKYLEKSCSNTTPT
jgi:cysteine desulfurase